MSASFDNHGQSADESVAESTGTCFRVGNLSIACTGRSLLEVLEVPEISPVGGTRPWFLGLASYRAELLPVTDFALWAGLTKASELVAREASQDDALSRARLLLIERTHPGAGKDPVGAPAVGEKIALLVEDVTGQVALDDVSLLETDKGCIETRLSECLDDVGQAGMETQSPATAASDRTTTVAKLSSLLDGYLGIGEPVFVADLEKLFLLDSFIQISLPRPDSASLSSSAQKGVTANPPELA